MDEDSFEGKITIEPEPEQREDFYSFSCYSVMFPTKASTRYTVRIAPGLKDIYGTVLAKGLTYEFTTPPMSPGFWSNIPNYYSFYSAYSSNTGFYINHVNLNQLGVQLYRLRVNDFIHLLQGWPNVEDTKPALYEKDLLYSRVRPLADPLNQYYPEFLNLGDDGPLLAGVYSLRLTAAKDGKVNNRDHHFLMVMSANLTVKASLNRVWVWATDIKTGVPITAAPIFIYGLNQQVIASGHTDADGFMTVAVPPAYQSLVSENRIAVLKTENHFGMGATNWADGIDPGWFEQQTAFGPDNYRIYTYTDRPVYRPGQPVYFRSIIRSKDDVTYQLPRLAAVPVQITDSKGNIVYSQEIPVTPFGTISGEFELETDAPLGYYFLRVALPSGTSDAYGGQGNTGFSVAEYRLPEFEVETTAQNDQVANGDTIRVQVNSQYYSGGAISNAQVHYKVISSPAYFHYTGKGRYNFTDYNIEADPQRYEAAIGGGQGETDEDGQFQFELPADLSERPYSQRYQIEATVQNENGQNVSARTAVLVHSGLIYLGARSERYISYAGEASTVQLIAVDWYSNPVANQSVAVEVVERRWRSVQEVDVYGHKTWTWEVEEIPVTTGAVTTNAEGQAVFQFTPANAGIFVARLSTRDTQGNPIRSATSFWVSGKEYISWRQENSNRIELIADKDDYAIGDTAEILIASPFQGRTQALITVERAGVMQSEVVTMDSNSYVYRLPIVPDYAPNVFVSVMLVKGVDEYNPVPAFRMGLIQLKVETTRKQLNLHITADQAQAQPGDTVRYAIQTTDYAGKPVQAEIGVGITDRAALALVDSQTPTLLDFFYRLQGIGVRTGTPLTINADQLTQRAMDILKGGGGGGGQLGVMEIREKFIDTPYWNPVLVTDATGKATFEVTLPDNLTTWHLDARAVTKGEDGVLLVGQGTHDLVSTRPLIVRPVTPRFFVVDDQVALGALVNNNTDAALEVEVALQSSGLTVADDLTQTITIPANGQRLVQWAATVTDVTMVELVFYADAGQYQDAARPALGQGEKHLLPVYRYEAQETVGTAGMLQDGGQITETISLPAAMNVTQGNLDIHLEPSLAVTTMSGLTYLENYPYQCIEQTVSRFLPNIMTYRALKELGVDVSSLKPGLDRNINFALQRLYQQQKTDGGWGWFENEPSNPLTTAYALIGLFEARQQGYPITSGVMERAQTFLQTTFVIPSLETPTWQLNRQAFVLYALALSGVPDVARSANLYEIRDRLNLDARAFLAMTFHLIRPDDLRAETLLSDLLAISSRSATGTYWAETEADYWNWTTDTRTTALALKTLVQLRPKSALIPNIVRWLVTKRTTWHWETTQETAWAVMGLTDWMKQTGELNPDYEYSVSLNDVSLAEGAITQANVTQPIDLKVQVKDLLQAQANALVIEQSDNNGALYYTAHLNAWLPVPAIGPLDRGIILERQYTRPGENTPIQAARVGDIIEVHLLIVAPSSLYYVAIEDPIPAGTEAINSAFKINQQIGTRPDLSRTDTFRYGWGWWWFSQVEFHDEKTVLTSGYLPSGTYEYRYYVRAAVPGVYNVIPTTGQEFYFPEVYGRGSGEQFTVLPAN
ncbi:MAG TPA: MG2 domain-containing protein, partial [Phototrophicaceae bacterium]|nr:MG2 domain-containing protein [Phototrophicaceae bacterium]